MGQHKAREVQQEEKVQHMGDRCLNRYTHRLVCLEDILSEVEDNQEEEEHRGSSLGDNAVQAGALKVLLTVHHPYRRNKRQELSVRVKCREGTLEKLSPRAL